MTFIILAISWILIGLLGVFLRDLLEYRTVIEHLSFSTKIVLYRRKGAPKP